MWAILCGSIFFFADRHRSLSDWVKSCAIAGTYANLIGLPATFGLARLGTYVKRHGLMTQALAYLAALLPISVGGCFAANVLFVAVHLWPKAALVSHFVADIRFTLMIALVVGGSVLSHGATSYSAWQTPSRRLQQEEKPRREP